MANESNEDYSFDYDENAAIDDDDSILSGESGKRDRRLRNIPDTSLYIYLSKRRKFIHFCFRRIRIISFIVTFLYNIFWIIKMKKISIDNEHADFNNFKNSIVKYSYIILIKGFVILFLPQVFYTVLATVIVYRFNVWLNKFLKKKVKENATTA